MTKEFYDFVKQPTLDSLRKAFSHLPKAQLQIPMNPLPTPQVAAVHQTLAGERLTAQVQFPLTGDSDCDFIQGILAVKAALGDMWPQRAELVLRFMAERFKSIDDNRSQPSQIDWQSAINQAVRRALDEERLQQVHQTPWYTTSGGGPPVGTNAAQMNAAQRAAIEAALAGVNIKPYTP